MRISVAKVSGPIWHQWGTSVSSDVNNPLFWKGWKTVRIFVLWDMQRTSEEKLWSSVSRTLPRLPHTMFFLLCMTATAPKVHSPHNPSKFLDIVALEQMKDFLCNFRVYHLHIYTSFWVSIVHSYEKGRVSIVQSKIFIKNRNHHGEQQLTTIWERQQNLNPPMPQHYCWCIVCWEELIKEQQLIIMHRSVGWYLIIFTGLNKVKAEFFAPQLHDYLSGYVWHLLIPKSSMQLLQTFLD